MFSLILVVIFFFEMSYTHLMFHMTQPMYISFFKITMHLLSFLLEISMLRRRKQRNSWHMARLSKDYAIQAMLQCVVMVLFSVFVVSSKVDRLSLWHKHLAHPFDVVFQRLVNASLLDSTNTLQNKSIYKFFHWLKCIKFLLSLSIFLLHLLLIYSIWIFVSHLLQPQMILGILCLLWMNFADICGCFMKTKDQGCSIFQSFIAMVERNLIAKLSL